MKAVNGFLMIQRRLSNDTKTSDLEGRRPM